MGRNIHCQSVPQRQRSQLPPNQELRRALRAPRPQAFGIRRFFTPDSQAPLLELFASLQADGEIPDEVERRARMQTTILSKRKIDRQLARGIVAGYQFGQAAAVTKRQIEDSALPYIPVILGDIVIIKDHYIAHRLISEELEVEVMRAQEMLGRVGVKGMMRRDQAGPPIHATLGEAKHRLRSVEQRHILHVLNDVMPVGEEVDLEELTFYPQANNTPAERSE